MERDKIIQEDFQKVKIILENKKFILGVRSDILLELDMTNWLKFVLKLENEPWLFP